MHFLDIGLYFLVLISIVVISFKRIDYLEFVVLISKYGIFFFILSELFCVSFFLLFCFLMDYFVLFLQVVQLFFGIVVVFYCVLWDSAVLLIKFAHVHLWLTRLRLYHGYVFTSFDITATLGHICLIIYNTGFVIKFSFVPNHHIDISELFF